MATNTVVIDEKELSQKAHSEFINKNYDSCISILDKLLEKHPNDIKIMHNKAIAQFYKSKQCGVNDLNKQINSLFNKAQIKTEQLTNFEEMEYSILLYNKAVLLYHQHHFNAALIIAEKLIEFIEPFNNSLNFDETFSRQVSFFLIELYLSTYQADRAHNLVSYLEKNLFPEQSKEKEDVNPNQKYRPQIHYYKARSLILLKSTKSCKKELKGLSNVGEGVYVNYLRGQLDYQKGTCKKALRTLNTGVHSLEEFESTGNMLPVMYYNNLACIYYKMQKYALASFYQSRSLSEFKTIMETLQEKKQETMFLYTRNLGLKYRLLFNAGIYNLHALRPNEAFEYLIQASRFYNTNPRLWLRIAECAIMKHKMDSKSTKSQANLFSSQIGQGLYRKLILTESFTEKFKPSGVSAAIPNPTLEFADICLKNALLLLPEDNLEVEDDIPIVNTYPSFPNQDLSQLRNSILAASAYVSLTLGNFYLAKEYADSLLEQAQISDLNKALGHLYLSESQILKNDMSGALKTLQSNLNLSIEDEPPLNAGSGWDSYSTSSFKAAFHFNLSYLYAIQRDWQNAMEHLSYFTDTEDVEIPIEAAMLFVYINLQQGNMEMAREILKNFTPNSKCLLPPKE